MQENRIHVYAAGFEQFLKEVQDNVLAGYRIDLEKSNGVFFSGFSCDMFLEKPWIDENKVVPTLEGDGPFTKEQMDGVSFDELKRYANTLNLTDRSKAGLIKKIIKSYNNA